MRPAGYNDATIDGLATETLEALRSLQKSKRWPAVLSGPTGTGKTCAAAVLFGTWHHLPMWHRADDFLLSISLGRADGVQVDTVNQYQETVRKTIPFKQFVNRVANCSCLFLDDLGTRQPTPPMYQALFDLLEWRKNRPLCITTNKTISELAQLYDDRIVSRLVGGTLIRFDGADRRKRGVVARVS